MSTLLDVPWHWYAVKDGDPRAVALYQRHYSRNPQVSFATHVRYGFVAEGESMILLTGDAQAIFAWQRCLIERMDGQTGICCSVFRNEGEVLSSLLIREADELAWGRWPGERHFTYVAPGKVRRKRDPGRGFVRAGWQVCGRNKDGRLLILERLP